jgi:hypothetical protein
MKYQKGDLVKVKEFAERPAYWCNDGSMDYLIGNVTEIEDVSCDGFYVKNGKNNYFIRFSDVEPVKSCITLYQTRGVVIGKNNITGKKVMRCTAEDTFDFNTAELVLKRLEMFENEVEVGDVVKILDLEQIYTDKELVKELSEGNLDIILRWLFGYGQFYNIDTPKSENAFTVIARDGLGRCLIENKEYSYVVAINEKGLEKLNVEHMKG